VDGLPAEARVTYGAGGPSVVVDGAAPALDAVEVEAADGIYVLRKGRQTLVRGVDPGFDPVQGGGDEAIRAPMHGKLLAGLVGAGDMVAKGQRLAIIEAMKMEHTLVAPHNGRVADIAVAAGTQVSERTRIMTVEAATLPAVKEAD
jgi:3-methylcrotonyl-CoA carboxylase alpha subunit